MENRFSEWIKDPSSLEGVSADKLVQSLERYPYFATPRMLLAKHRELKGDPAYQDSVHRAAVYCRSRSRFRDWLEGEGAIAQHSAELELQDIGPVETIPEETPDAAVEVMDQVLERGESDLADSDQAESSNVVDDPVLSDPQVDEQAAAETTEDATVEDESPQTVEAPALTEESTTPEAESTGITAEEPGEDVAVADQVVEDTIPEPAVDSEVSDTESSEPELTEPLDDEDSSQSDLEGAVSEEAQSAEVNRAEEDEPGSQFVDDGSTRSFSEWLASVSTAAREEDSETDAAAAVAQDSTEPSKEESILKGAGSKPLADHDPQATPRPVAPAEDMGVLSGLIAKQRQKAQELRGSAGPVSKASARAAGFNDPQTETYASILAAQGKFDRARAIYEALSLKNPDKSSYFAGLIDELDKRSGDGE